MAAYAMVLAQPRRLPSAACRAGIHEAATAIAWTRWRSRADASASPHRHGMSCAKGCAARWNCRGGPAAWHGSKGSRSPARPARHRTRTVRIMPGSSGSRRSMHPRIAICVLVENAGFGGSHAAPIAGIAWSDISSARRAPAVRRGPKPQPAVAEAGSANHPLPETGEHVRLSSNEHFDLQIGISSLLLALIGLVSIYSATYDARASEIFMKQVAWAGCRHDRPRRSLRSLPFRLLQTLSVPAYLFSLFLLVIVLLLGKTVSGSTSWFNLGSFRIQPSEFAKITTVLALASYLSRSDVSLRTSAASAVRRRDRACTRRADHAAA